MMMMFKEAKRRNKTEVEVSGTLGVEGGAGGGAASDGSPDQQRPGHRQWLLKWSPPPPPPPPLGLMSCSLQQDCVSSFDSASSCQ